MTLNVKSLAARFWAKVNKQGPMPSHAAIKAHNLKGRCWEWTASTNRKGYGQIGIETVAGWLTKRAPQVAWFLAIGRWPKFWCLHRCDNRLCVRFSHLYEGSATDNNREREQKGRSNHPIGEVHHQAKLSEQAVREIKKALTNNRRGLQTQLAACYHVSGTTITNIKLNRVRRTK